MKNRRYSAKKPGIFFFRTKILAYNEKEVKTMKKYAKAAAEGFAKGLFGGSVIYIGVTIATFGVLIAIGGISG